jgi:ParB-like chromosome segregation protein Spo0J
MKISKIWLDALVVGERHRKVDDAKVAVLAESLSAIGLQQPVSVWFDEQDGMHLVAGLHRVRAAEKLGWEQIDAVTVELDDVDRERWEIAENLHRSELTALERDGQIARWIELTDQKRLIPQSAEKTRGRPPKGTSTSARDLGIDEDDARRAVKVASLSAEAKKAAVDAGLDDNRTALLAAAKHTESSKQVTHILAEAARRQAEKERKDAEKFNRDQDRVVEMTDAEQFAAWLMSNSSIEEVPMLISWLEGTRSRDVIAALRRAAA